MVLVGNATGLVRDPFTLPTPVTFYLCHPIVSVSLARSRKYGIRKLEFMR